MARHMLSRTLTLAHSLSLSHTHTQSRIHTIPQTTMIPTRNALALTAFVAVGVFMPDLRTSRHLSVDGNAWVSTDGIDHDRISCRTHMIGSNRCGAVQYNGLCVYERELVLLVIQLSSTRLRLHSSPSLSLSLSLSPSLSLSILYGYIDTDSCHQGGR